NFAGVQITSLPTTGTLYVNGAPATLNQIVVASTVTAGNFTFVPNTDVTAPGSFNDVVGTSSNGALTKTNSSVTLNVTADSGPSANVTTAGSFNFTVTDSLGGTQSATAAAMTINITGSTATDTGPTAVASTVQVTEDLAYTFKATDFGYSDSFDPADPMASV